MRTINICIRLELLGLVAMLIGLVLYITVPSIGGVDTYYYAFYLTVGGLVCAVPALIYLTFLLIRRRQIRSRLITEYIRHGSDDTRDKDLKKWVGADEMSEIKQNIEKIREIQQPERDERNEQLENLEDEIRALNAKLKEAESIPAVAVDTDNTLSYTLLREQLEAERAILEIERQKLEEDRLESENFAKTQLESALLGKGHIENLMSENKRLESSLQAKEQIELEKTLRLNRYKELRKASEQEKKTLLSRENIERLFRKYFTEVGVCFLVDRDKYKDKFGLAPYNKAVITASIDGKPDVVQHYMAATENRLFKFCEILPDVERFLNHGNLYPAFLDLINKKTTHVRISEKLHLLYLQMFRKDFIKDYRYKEDFENLLILVINNHKLRGKNFKTVFTNRPFVVPVFTDAEIISYLGLETVKNSFSDYFPDFADFGFENLNQAMYICFVSSIKESLNITALSSAILKDCGRITKGLRSKKKKQT